MTTNDRTITEQLPDLPQLESAEAGTAHTWPIAVIVMGMLYLFAAGSIWFVLRFEPYLGGQLPLMYGVVVMLVVVSLWMTGRLLFDDHHWRTTPEGLHAASVLRKRFLRWDDVQEATSRHSSLHSTPACAIAGRTGRFRIYPVGTYSMLSLYASVWQHLRRLGKADGLNLPSEILSMWDSIPDELPSEVEWTDPRPPWVWPNALLPAAFVVGALWLAIPEARQGHSPIAVLILLVGSILPLMFASVIREILVNAREASLNDERLEAVTRRGTVALPWSEVTGARWTADPNSGQRRILIRGGTPHQKVGIVYKPADEGSSKLILAIVRRLRIAGTPQSLMIPETLRSLSDVGAQREAAAETQPVVVRLTWLERLSVTFVPGVPVGMLVGLILGDKPNPPAWQIAIPTVAGCALSLLLGATYQIRADSDGVARRFALWSKSIVWQDVAGYSVFMPTAKSTITKRLLCRNGRALMNVAPYVGTKSDQERFLAYVHARLAEVLPAEVLNPPWKARPWTPP